MTKDFGSYRPNADPVLRIRVREKHYRDRLVLSGVDLALEAGGVTALIGPSGCGKSTLLRIAAGLDRDYDGAVLLQTEPICGPCPQIGLMFQEPRLLPWLTVARNVEFGQPRSVSVVERAAALLGEVGLQSHGDRLPRELSGGMAQRVALARAFLREPRVLLLDEPFGAVDALTRVALQALLLQVVERHGSAALIVTRDVEEALFVADRIVVLPGRPGGESAVFHNDRGTRDRGDARIAALRSAVLDRLTLSTPAHGARARPVRFPADEPRAERAAS
jgi:sulfonate transport system ATP-binding protein